MRASIKKIYIILIFILFYLSSYSIEKINIIADDLEIDCAKGLLLQQEHSIGQASHNKEKWEKTNNHDGDAFSPFCNIFLSCCPSINFFWESKKEQEKNICSLPAELLLYVADFLDSPDILRLSCSCKKLRQVFNNNYWLAYWGRISKTCPYLTLHFPPMDRKAFFAHLWYSEGYIKLAAKLNHPEAKALREYSKYGVVIGKDQYLCPSGSIKYVSTEKVDNEQTEKLRRVEKQKQREDRERHEILTTRSSSRFSRVLGWYGKY